jgi:tryptophan-rich sensory protein
MTLAMRRYGLLVLFIAAVLGGGMLIGSVTRPGAWYAALTKPSFNPPNWIFGPVWSLLYVMIGVAGWRTWMRDRADISMKVWFANLALNFLWSPVFFGMQRPGLALFVIAPMLITALLFIALRWGRDTVSAVLFLPYAAWVAFATLLNAAIWHLN